MNFWKKLFAGMGFVCGFLVFEAMSLAYHNSSRRHKNRRCSTAPKAAVASVCAENDSKDRIGIHGR